MDFVQNYFLAGSSDFLESPPLVAWQPYRNDMIKKRISVFTKMSKRSFKITVLTGSVTALVTKK